MNKLPLFFSYNDIIKVSKIQQIFCYFKENTSMDFQKVLSENAEKKCIYFTTNISTYLGHIHVEVL